MAVIFDLDGTLLDTPSAIARLLVSVSEEFSAGVDIETARRTVGKPLDTSMATILGVTVDDPRVHQAVERYRQKFEDEVVPNAPDLVLDGVEDILQNLRSDGVPVAVATSKVRNSAEAILVASGLRAYFDVVVGHDDVARGKPAPEMALRAAELLRVGPDTCTVFGDSADDVLMAKSAGMRAIGVLTGVADRETLRAAGADEILSSLVGIPQDAMSPRASRV